MNRNLNLLLEGKIESYWWTCTSTDNLCTTYEFEDEEFGYRYLVEFKNKFNRAGGKKELTTTYELLYYLFDDYKQEWSVSILSGHNIWRVIKTVFGNILTDFLTNNKRFKIDRCQELIIVGLSKTLEKSYQSQRTRVYLRFLVRNPIPGFKVECRGNTITLIRL